MNFLEKDLEEVIFLSTQKEKNTVGLSLLSGKCKRQLRIGNYGIADLVYFEKVNDFGESVLRITVCELKKDKAGISAFLQAIRYCKGIQSYLEKRKPNLKFYFNIVLIAKEIDTNSDYIFISDLISNLFDYDNRCLKNIYNYSFKYTLDGIKFKRHYGYTLADENFKL